MDEKRWIEFHGGPYDGTMAEAPTSMAGTAIYGPGEELPDGRYRIGPALGQYVEGDAPVEGLDVTYYEWTSDLKDVPVNMEGRIIRRNSGDE